MTIVKQAIGILGGTFDPIHLGHTLPVQAVAKWLCLDKVIYLPASIPPHKSRPNISADVRAKMVSLACQQNPLFECDTRELNRDGHSYTIDTIKELSSLYPKHTLYFMMGMDSLLTFTTWKSYQQILSLCHIVVNTRPNYSLPELSCLPMSTQQLLKNHRVFTQSELQKRQTGGIIFSQDLYNLNGLNDGQAPKLDISSTELRTMLKNNQDCSAYINTDVLKYINEHKLYR